MTARRASSAARVQMELRDLGAMLCTEPANETPAYGVARTSLPVHKGGLVGWPVREPP
jgi:hypothetical protein